MTRQNRVHPDGSIVADSARGMLMGNRGVLHDDHGVIRRVYGSPRAWVTCRLAFKGRRRDLMQPGRYTELFFLDEAVAFAAGHRPCAECRRDAYRAFRAAWDGGNGITPALGDLDRTLHSNRIECITRLPRRHRAVLDKLPDGTFILHDQKPHLVKGRGLMPFAFSGYGPAIHRPIGETVTVLTPACTVAVLGAGYRVTLHSSAT